MFYNSQLGRGLYGVYEINTELLKESIKNTTLQNRLHQLYQDVNSELVYKAEQAVSKCSIDCNWRKEFADIEINKLYEKYVLLIRNELPKTKYTNFLSIEEKIPGDCRDTYFKRIWQLLEDTDLNTSEAYKGDELLQDFTQECESKEKFALEGNFSNFDVVPMCQFINRLIFANPLSFKNTRVEGEKRFAPPEIADLISFKEYTKKDCEAVFKTLKQFGIVQTHIDSISEYVYEPYQVYASYLQFHSESLNNPLSIVIGCGHHAVKAHELEKFSSKYPSTGTCRLCNHAISEDKNNLMINIYDQENPDIIWDAFKDARFYQELHRKNIGAIADHTGFHIILDEEILPTLHRSISSGTRVEVSGRYGSDELKKEKAKFSKFGFTLLESTDNSKDNTSIYLQKR